MEYIQQSIEAVGLSLRKLAGVQINIQYVNHNDLNVSYVSGFLLSSGHNIKKCKFSSFNDRDGGSGIVAQLP